MSCWNCATYRAIRNDPWPTLHGTAAMRLSASSSRCPRPSSVEGLPRLQLHRILAHKRESFSPTIPATGLLLKFLRSCLRLLCLLATRFLLRGFLLRPLRFLDSTGSSDRIIVQITSVRLLAHGICDVLVDPTTKSAIKKFVMRPFSSLSP
jgi:hypothetical protein